MNLNRLCENTKSISTQDEHFGIGHIIATILACVHREYFFYRNHSNYQEQMGQTNSHNGGSSGNAESNRASKRNSKYKYAL